MFTCLNPEPALTVNYQDTGCKTMYSAVYRPHDPRFNALNPETLNPVPAPINPQAPKPKSQNLQALP